jgi:hypothetical protein
MTRFYPDQPVVIGSHEDVVWKLLTEVAAERQQQVAIGYSPTSDDAYVDRELARASAAYALNGGLQHSGSLFWPWPGHTWKPADPRRDLIRAAALALAEVERIDRAALVEALT